MKTITITITVPDDVTVAGNTAPAAAPPAAQPAGTLNYVQVNGSPLTAEQIAKARGYNFPGLSTPTMPLGLPFGMEGESDVSEIVRMEAFKACGIHFGRDTPTAGTLDPVYPSEAALLAAADAIKYDVALKVDDRDVRPGFGPPDVYKTQPDGSVVKAN